MLVLFEHNGVDFLVRAKPIGRNGYMLGTVVYAAPKDLPPAVAQVKAPATVAPPKAVVEAPRIKEALPNKAIDEARKHKNLSIWDDSAKAFWIWLKENRKSGGLVTALHQDFRESRGEKRSPGLAFQVVACGERYGYWKVKENERRTRFSLEIME